MIGQTQQIITIYDVVDKGTKKIPVMIKSWVKFGNKTAITTNRLVTHWKEYEEALVQWQVEMGKLHKWTYLSQNRLMELNKILGVMKKPELIDYQDVKKDISVLEDYRRRFQYFWLSIMFGAMQVQRFMGRVFDDLKKSYFDVTENTTALGQATLRLQGAFTYLQVSIMTALEPVLVPILEWLINAVTWFSNLDPWVLRLAGYFVIGGLFTAGLLAATSQLALFVAGIKGLLTTLGLLGPKIATNVLDGYDKWAMASVGLTKSTSSLITWMPLVATAALVALAIIISGWDHFSNAITMQSKMTTAAMADDWEAYKSAALARNGELVGGIFWGLARMGRQFTMFMFDLRDMWGNLISLIDPERGWKILEASIKDRMTYEKKFFEGEKLMTVDYIKNLLKAGVTMEDVLSIYGQAEKTKNLVRDASIGLGRAEEYELAVAKLAEDAKIRQTSASLDYTQAIEDEKNKLASLNDETQRQIDLAARMGMTGTYTFGPGALPGYAGKTFTAGELAQAEAERLGQAFSEATECVSSFGQSIAQTTTQSINPFGADYWAASVAHLQKGGLITKEGLAYVHRGETVIPKEEGGLTMGNISVNITTGPITSPADEESLARKVSERIMNDIKNYTKYVTHF